MKPLPPGSWLGMLGGGQLGRMAVHAAQRLGYRVAVLDPDLNSPAGSAADEHLCAPYEEPRALAQLAQLCPAISTEFENVPARVLAKLAESCFVAPAATAVAVCQDRAAEKAHFARSQVPCAPHAVLASSADCEAADAALLPGILKTATLGYDGKGQRRVRDRAELLTAFRELGGVRCVLEALLPLAAELSVVVARGQDGAMSLLPVQRNWHEDGILATTVAPATGVANECIAQAEQHARAIAEAMGYVGVLCIEFFVLEDGRLLANEMAPRPHNSGHHSIDSCSLSQFDLQVRALAGLPLPAVRQHSATVMLNLLGDLWFDAQGQQREPDWAGLLALEGTHLHLYGKVEPRRARKMGHLTLTAASAEDAAALARRAAALLRLPCHA
ncbi:MAG: 5-(carboxyamino)imidazole ribonucleotide synthase [Burkholderiales bacterium]|uniref:5-(carboxyamino)imidazole ribonucleotide synthase n=1 Tax=Inhella sp. TaxID=1921806 RepID=UPI001AC97B39|nr:5-(carboxyamino)imidazole ribonucleotide synthase [Burkholderiales bacterium]